MKLILISDNGESHKKLSINLIFHVLMPLLLLGLISFASLFLAQRNDAQVSKNESQLIGQFEQVLLKTALLEAQVQRLNSLGSHLAQQSNIDIANFNLESKPSLGGIQKQNFDDTHLVTQSGLLNSIDEIESRLSRQSDRFGFIRDLLAAKSYDKQLDTESEKKSQKLQYGTFTSPVRKGYISSSYGLRKDPLNGHRRHHNGLDIAAKHGTKIHAIASGFVTFSGRKGGYGNVVEIHHSDSLKSRYAHLHTIDVEKGSVVRKGDNIATMGTTGRSTGSHLHLEIWKNKTPIDPIAYLDIVIR